MSMNRRRNATIRLTGFGKPETLSPAVEAFLRAFYDASYPSPFSPNERTERALSGIDAVVEVTPKYAGIHLDEVRALTRKQGEGTKAMRFLTALADKHGIKLSLYAKPFGSEAMNRDTLVNFYRRFGFYPDEAEEEDEGTEMYRWPRERLRSNPARRNPSGFPVAHYGALATSLRAADRAGHLDYPHDRDAALREWASEHGVAFLGAGMHRVVFRVPEGALKVSLKPVWHDRMYGNLAEARVWSEAPLALRKHLVPVLAVAEDGAWLLQEYAPTTGRERTPKEQRSVDAMWKAMSRCGYMDFQGNNIADDGRLLDYGSAEYPEMWKKCVSRAAAKKANPARKAQHVYHLTYASNLPFIARQGLVPRADTEAAWDNEPGVYFVNVFGYEAGAPESEEPAWLRFPAPAGLPPKFFTGMNEGHANVVFPASSIEVWADARGRPVSKSDRGRWKPLVEVVRPRANPARKAKPSTLAAAGLPEVWFHGTQKTFGKLKAQGGACIWLADKRGAMAYATPHYGRRSAIRLIEVTLAPDTRVVDLADASDPAVREFIRLDASASNMRWHGREDVTAAEMADAVERWNARRTHYDAIEARSWAKAHFRKAGADALLVRDVAGWGGHEAMPSLCLLNPKKVVSERDVAPDLSLVRAEDMPKYENPARRRR